MSYFTVDDREKDRIAELFKGSSFSTKGKHIASLPDMAREEAIEELLSQAAKGRFSDGVVKVDAQLFFIPVQFDNPEDGSGVLRNRFEGAAALTNAIRTAEGQEVRLVARLYSYAEVNTWTARHLRATLIALVRRDESLLPKDDPEFVADLPDTMGHGAYIVGAVVSKKGAPSLEFANWDRSATIGSVSIGMQIAQDMEFFSPRLLKAAVYKEALVDGVTESIKSVVKTLRAEDEGVVHLEVSHHEAMSMIQLNLQTNSYTSDVIVDMFRIGNAGVARVIGAAYEIVGERNKYFSMN